MGKRMFYGWWIVFASLIAQAFGVGIAYFTFPVFYPSLMNEFGWSRAQTVAGGSIAVFLYGFANPLVGWLCDQYGAKRTKMIGLVFIGGSLFLLALERNLWEFYVLSALLGFGISNVSQTSSQVLISKWFKRNEGLAFGIVIAGVGLGGFGGPLLASYLIDHVGWRRAFWGLDLLVWLLVLPLFFFVVKEFPEDMGLSPDGIADGARPAFTSEPNAPVLDEGLTFAETLRSSAFWLLSAGAFLITAVILSITQHLVLFLQNDVGMSLPAASAMLGLILFVSIPGKIVIGYLSDRMSRKLILVVCSFLLSPALCLLILSDGSRWLLYAMCMLAGMSYGAVFVLVPLLVSEYFGRRALGRVLGWVLVLTSVGGALGPLMAGRLRDMYGTYMAAFFPLVAVALIAGIILLFMPPSVMASALSRDT